MAVIDGYLGPSRRQPSGGSRASVARWQIQRWTEARGWRVGRILEEATPQASPAPRWLRELAVERVESYETDGLVTTSLRELGDSLTEVICTIERIDAAGGAFASLHEGFDLTTDRGRHTFRLLLFVLEWEQPGEPGRTWGARRAGTQGPAGPAGAAGGMGPAEPAGPPA